MEYRIAIVIVVVVETRLIRIGGDLCSIFFSSSSSIVGDLSIWDYNSNCVFYEERRNERVELKG